MCVHTNRVCENARVLRALSWHTQTYMHIHSVHSALQRSVRREVGDLRDRTSFSHHGVLRSSLDDPSGR